MRHRRRRLILGVAVAAFLVAGCGAAAPEPTSTPTATPTAAPTDTPTPEPTATPEPTSTPTPDLAATAAVEATEAMNAVLAEIDAELQTIGYSAEQGSLAWIDEGEASISLNTFNTHSWIPLSDGNEFSDFILRSDVTWESTSGLAICGFWFRGDSDDEDAAHYKFQTIRLSGLPSWDVEYWKFNRRQATVSPGGRVLTTPHIDQDQGSTNTYIFVAEGNVMTVYANGNRLGQVTLNTLREGLLAFYAYQESGETTCEFHNAWVWDLRDG